MKKNASYIFGATLSAALLLSACGGVQGDEQDEPGQLGQAVGVTGPAFYVDGQLYRTVGTPRDLPTNAPDHSFDVIYAVSAYQTYNVAGAAPGQPGFNGGRWKVRAVSFADYPAALAAHDENGSGDFDSDEEIHAALSAGDAVDGGVVRVFECPVIHLPGA